MELELVGGGVDPDSLPAQLLAYVGDAVYELYVRTRLVSAGSVRPQDVHLQAVALVRAEAQADALQRLGPVLTQEEREIVRKGRNVPIPSTGGASPASRHYSTALEALVGYLYLSGRRERLKEIMRAAIPDEVLANAWKAGGSGRS